ncbi:hypothetical protein ACIOGT_25395 [Streptomyces microflavus]|uniref:hypothetical protein n=1 Tax=Streptomyces microflavus TaxID=1919 RepID=UPI00380C1B28
MTMFVAPLLAGLIHRLKVSKSAAELDYGRRLFDACLTPRTARSATATNLKNPAVPHGGVGLVVQAALARAGMWADVEVTESHAMLEARTGTGYSTALACEQLGSADVTSIEIASHLVPRRACQLLGSDQPVRFWRRGWESFGTSLGGLRVTVANRFQKGEFDGGFADQATTLTDAAETSSERTCETCGHPGRVGLCGYGPRTWMQSSCDTCRSLPMQDTAPADSTEISRLGASRP